MKHSTICLLSALGGALVGAMITALITPQSGKELRGKIRTAVNDAKAKMHEMECGECGCGCEE